MVSRIRGQFGSDEVEARAQMTDYLYPSYYEIYKSSAILARKAIIKAYEETGNISEVARLYRTTRQTMRKLLRRAIHSLQAYM